MKPVNELSPEDFERARIWRFVQPDDGAPDETWVVATSYKTIPRDCYSLLVSARFVRFGLQDREPAMGWAARRRAVHHRFLSIDAAANERRRIRHK